MGALGTIIFLAILAYWTWKTRLRLHKYPVIVINIPLLLASSLGFVFQDRLREFGGLVCHTGLFCATYAVIATGLYLWYRITHSWIKAVILVFLTPLVFRLFLSSGQVDDKLPVQAIFMVMALALFVPAVIHCLLNGLRNLSFLLTSSSSFAVGIFLRNLEFPFLPSSVDNKFSWHVFFLVSVFSLLHYLFLTEQDKNRKRQDKVPAGTREAFRVRDIGDI